MINQNDVLLNSGSTPPLENSRVGICSTTKKILIRSGITPFEAPTYEDILTKNIIGANLGNLLYATSVYKSLYVDSATDFKTMYAPIDLSKKYIDEINDTCKCFVIPLADALRKDFVADLEQYTELVKQLKIPCYIIGMGVRAAYEPEKDFHYSFDDTVKNFIAAVLDKSAVVGVRGQITADYLSRLGFKLDKHVQVIGCPSMYLFGDKLEVKNKIISKDLKVTYNTQIFANYEFSNYLFNQARNFDKYFLLPQEIKELRYMYRKDDLKIERASNSVLEKMYLTENCLFFNNAKSWLDFLENVDFTFGTRLHGCIASLIKSNPVLLVALQKTPILMGVECSRRRCYDDAWNLYKVNIAFTGLATMWYGYASIVVVS